MANGQFPDEVGDEANRESIGCVAFLAREIVAIFCRYPSFNSVAQGVVIIGEIFRPGKTGLITQAMSKSTGDLSRECIVVAIAAVLKEICRIEKRVGSGALRERCSAGDYLVDVLRIGELHRACTYVGETQTGVEADVLLQRKVELLGIWIAEIPVEGLN